MLQHELFAGCSFSKFGFRLEIRGCRDRSMQNSEYMTVPNSAVFCIFSNNAFYSSFIYVGWFFQLL